MATTPTTGDIPSNAAVDLKFNSEQFDRVMNSDDLTYTDRFGKKRITMKGVQELANGFQDTFTNLLGSPDGFKLIGGVKSFDTLRSTPVKTEGQRIFLKSYHENGTTGGGIFVGHIGTKLDDGGTVAQGVGFYWERADCTEISVEIFGGTPNDNTIDNSDFIIAADLVSFSKGVRLTGKGLNYSVGRSFTLVTPNIKDIKISPTSSFTGDAPTFTCDQNTGELVLEDVDISDFKGRGSNCTKGNYTLVPTITFKGTCKFNGNGGGPTRTTVLPKTTTISAAADLTTTSVISVADTSKFIAGDYVLVNGVRYRILSVDSSSQITFYNTSSIPTIYNDGVNSSVSAGDVLEKVFVVNTASEAVIDVADSTIFKVGDAVWIGDSKCLISVINNSTQITLVNVNGVPTLQYGGTGTGRYTSGQYVTKDKNGKNGFTINTSSSIGWNINLKGNVEFNNNGWFGLFQWCNASGGTVFGGAKANNNGYIGVGLGYVKGGELSGFVTNNNGNNGLDLFETYSETTIHDCTSNNNGVDGIFVASSKTAPKLYANTCVGNKRIGMLANGRTVTPVGLTVLDNFCVGNDLYSICLTGIGGGIVGDCSVGGGMQGIRIEGKNGIANPKSITVRDCKFSSVSSESDIFANIGGYTNGGDQGSLHLNNNSYFGRTPKFSITNIDVDKSTFIPAGYSKPNGTDLSASAGTAIAVGVTFFKPHAPTVIDNSAEDFTVQIYTNSGLTTVGTVTTATRTAGVELSNGATSNGRIIGSPAYGTFSYNFTLSSPGTRYLHIKSKYGSSVIKLTWS